nr:uncharacterized protein LOC116433076 [Nomia melanderi]
MKRGTKCIAQTINLSNPETCIRPRRVQRLVDAEGLQQPCPSAGPSSYWAPRPVPVKVCSRRDMQRTCPPKLCDCPPKAPPKSLGQKFCEAVLFVLKSGVAAGLVYWTNSEGLWGSSDDVQDLYQRILATVAPSTLAGHDYDDPESTRAELFKQNLARSYNDAVYGTMKCIAGASSTVQQRIQRVLTKRRENLEEASSNMSADDDDES